MFAMSSSLINHIETVLIAVRTARPTDRLAILFECRSLLESVQASHLQTAVLKRAEQRSREAMREFFTALPLTNVLNENAQVAQKKFCDALEQLKTAANLGAKLGHDQRSYPCRA